VIIGFDLDGVIAELDIPTLRLIDLALKNNDEERKHVERYYFSYRPVEVNSNLFCNYHTDKLIILTSRPKEFRDLTEEWLRNNGIRYDKLIMADNILPTGKTDLSSWFEDMAKSKAKILKEEGVEIYFEDTPDMVKALREMCPDIKIIQYGLRSLKQQ